MVRRSVYKQFLGHSFDSVGASELDCVCLLLVLVFVFESSCLSRVLLILAPSDCHYFGTYCSVDHLFKFCCLLQMLYVSLPIFCRLLQLWLTRTEPFRFDLRVPYYLGFDSKRLLDVSIWNRFLAHGHHSNPIRFIVLTVSCMSLSRNALLLSVFRLFAAFSYLELIALRLTSGT